MDLERHPVFCQIELGPDLLENGLPNVAEWSIEVVKYEQLVDHVSLFYDYDSAGGQPLRPWSICTETGPRACRKGNPELNR